MAVIRITHDCVDLNLSEVRGLFENLPKATDAFPGNVHTTQDSPDSLRPAAHAHQGPSLDVRLEKEQWDPRPRESERFRAVMPSAQKDQKGNGHSPWYRPRGLVLHCTLQVLREPLAQVARAMVLRPQHGPGRKTPLLSPPLLLTAVGSWVRQLTSLHPSLSL